jgi:hypothetical protein
VKLRLTTTRRVSVPGGLYISKLPCLVDEPKKRHQGGDRIIITTTTTDGKLRSNQINAITLNFPAVVTLIQTNKKYTSTSTHNYVRNVDETWSSTSNGTISRNASQSIYGLQSHLSSMYICLQHRCFLLFHLYITCM